MQPFAVTPPGAARVGSPLSVVARVPEHIDLFWVGPDGNRPTELTRRAVANMQKSSVINVVSLICLLLSV